MNTRSIPAWNTLTAKSGRELKRAQSLLSAANARVSQAQLRMTKLDNLLVEYSSSLNDMLSKPHSTQEAGNFRQFIVQLQFLKQRADIDLHKAELDVTEAKSEVIVADQENLKLSRLLGRAKTELENQRIGIETKEAESQSIIQFNLKAPPSL